MPICNAVFFMCLVLVSFLLPSAMALEFTSPPGVAANLSLQLRLQKNFWVSEFPGGLAAGRLYQCVKVFCGGPGHHF